MPDGSFFTNSSIARIASPELFPGAASPRMLSEGNALNRSRRGDPVVHRPVAKAENGTIFDALLRT